MYRKYNPLFALLTITAAPRAFDNEGGGGWKMDGDKMALADGNPVWLDADGTERTIKRDTIPALQAENKTFRTKAQEYEAKMREFEGLDPKAAREALNKLKDVDLSKMVGADKLEEVKGQLKGEYESKIAEYDGTVKTLQSKLDNMVLDSAFNQSQFIKENIAVPTEMFRAAFGQYFKLNDGKIEAFDRAGNRIMSKKSIGEYADFDEAVELLVEGYSQRDAILKAPDQRGSGSNGAGGNSGGGSVIREADFEKMNPAQQAEASVRIREGKLRLV